MAVFVHALVFNVASSSYVPTSIAAGTVNSVSNSDGSLTISPTTGAAVASLNTAHANTWTAQQTVTQETVSLSTNETFSVTLTTATP